MSTTGPAPLAPRTEAAHPISPESRRRTLIIAILADVLQLGLFPLLGAGWLSPVNNLVDVVVAIVLIRLLGWHLAFLPTFIAELLPFVDIFPSWTLAVLFVTRRKPDRTPGPP